MALNEQRRLFVEAYLQTFSPTKAARKAGYSEKTIWSKASHLMDEPEVQALIKERLSDEAMTSNEVLHRLGDQGRASVEEFIELGIDEGLLAELEVDLVKAQATAKNIALLETIRAEADLQVIRLRDQIRAVKADKIRLNLEKAQANNKLHLIKSLKPTKYGMTVELHDAQAALVHIGKHFKLFTDNVDMTSKGEQIQGVVIYLPDNGRDSEDPASSGTAESFPLDSG